MKKEVDINADVGERPDALENGSEEEIIARISSANIACGAHAGDEASMRAAVRFCARHGVAPGAHPGYPDRANFGRLEMDLSLDEVDQSVCEQVLRLAAVAAREGLRLGHVKPHGALYNAAARDPRLAAAIARAVRRAGPALVLVGLAGSCMLDAGRAEGLEVAAEAFADRRYEPDGSLRVRKHADALITDPEEAARQALGIVRDGAVRSVSGSPVAISAQTICVHSDTPGALAILTALCRILAEAGIEVRRAVRPCM